MIHLTPVYFLTNSAEYKSRAFSPAKVNSKSMLSGSGSEISSQFPTAHQNKLILAKTTIKTTIVTLYFLK